MKKKLTRRNLLKVMGLGTVGAGMLSVNSAEANVFHQTKKIPVLRFAFLTDMHLKPGVEPEKGLRKCIDAILANEEPVDFFVNGGDVIMDALGENMENVEAQWAVWRKIRSEYPDLKFHHCIGNHDVWGAAAEGEVFAEKAWALSEHGMEKPYYDFQSNGWQFIVLDSTHKKDDGSWYTAKLDPEQRDWLEQRLNNISPEKPILIISHIPILGATPFLDGDNAQSGNWVVPGAWMHTDAKSLTYLFNQHKNVKVCISGHIHLVETLVYNDVHYHCSGAVSGNWWGDTPYEFTDNGYGFFELFEDGSHTFKYVEFDKKKV
ncbi:metallophosphoesterase family protein [Mongoliibacter ruber]|uniref:Calcineurin-like phosphoesterase family protein n=1 Tax=Mongoliibacter ruber TaxID=1750599 RepID=A0A2T0WQQ4_9BACT|nr:metallophosphoesterase [Mongoliibacter ruber]PRY89043.1 calcineurin-like phosphoesterase family protein [Mongoliibacter ruber]